MPPAAPRVRLAIVLLGAALLLVAAAVVACLVSLHDPVLAAIVAVAGGAGILGGSLAYVLSREEDPLSTGEPDAVVATVPVATPAKRPRAATRVQSLPLADLPPAYLAAVMKGVHANRAAHASRAQPGAELRH